MGLNELVDQPSGGGPTLGGERGVTFGKPVSQEGDLSHHLAVGKWGPRRERGGGHAKAYSRPHILPQKVAKPAEFCILGPKMR
jgi:hypothetical protein